VATEKANSTVATGTNSLNSSTQNTTNVATEKANATVANGTNSLNSSTQNTANAGTEKANTAVSTGTNSLNSSTQKTANAGTEKANSTVASGTNSLNSSTQSTTNIGTEKANAAVATGTNSLNSSAGTTSNRIKSIETNNVITETESTITETKTPEKVIVSENKAEQTMASEVKTPKPATKKAVSFSELPSEQPEAQNSVSNGTKSRFSIDNFKISSSAIKPSRTFFENVYFDFNSADLTAISKKAMDQLVQYYGENKEIQIDIKAYSDGFGNPAYNKNLAEQRGKACYDYFLAQGVDQTALVVTPAGENNPVANNNSFAGRQLNRRVEFAIIGSKTAFQPEAMAHVLEPRMTLFSVAKKYGMTMQELRNWNGGINAEDIKAYSVLRVRRPKNASKIAPASFNYINSGTEEMRFENGQFVPNGK
ncbi:MAG: LysM peptidoglycan-binding domain-containing protein, partial [Cytophagales bacterium]